MEASKCVCCWVGSWELEDEPSQPSDGNMVRNSKFQDILTRKSQRNLTNPNFKIKDGCSMHQRYESVLNQLHNTVSVSMLLLYVYEQNIQLATNCFNTVFPGGVDV